MVDMIFGEIFR